MFGRKKKAQQSIPWYRKRGYKGNLTEEEKMELDSYRWLASQPGGKHPAAEYSNLPEEVQSYISKLEIQLYDKIQGELVLAAFLLNAAFGFYLLNYFGWIAPKYDSDWLAFLSILMLFVPWIYYAVKFGGKNADEFWEKAGGEGIRFEWELDHVVSKKVKVGRELIKLACPLYPNRDRRADIAGCPRSANRRHRSRIGLRRRLASLGSTWRAF